MVVVESIFSSLEMQMSLLLFVALAGYLLASRINQSAVVGIILAGIAVGPSWLNLITYSEFVSSLAHLGAIVLLFTVGLHFKIKDILNVKYFIIALCGLVIPWIGGYYVANLFGFSFAGAVFVGTALTATSIAITANVLKEMGKLQTDVAKAIIGAAIIDDILSLLALSITEEVVSGTLTASLIGISLLKAILFLAGGIIVGKIIANRVMGRIDKSKISDKHPEIIFIFAMMVAFLYGLVAELIGLSAIVGSFLAGVVLEGVNLDHKKDFRHGAEILNIIFGSIFFVSLGVLVDVHLVTRELTLFILVISSVAILTKLIGCGLPAKLMGFNIKDSLAIGFGMSPRGEVAMIVGLIGLNQNLIGQNTYVALVMMSLITTIITPLIFRNWLFKGNINNETVKNAISVH